MNTTHDHVGNGKKKKKIKEILHILSSLVYLWQPLPLSTTTTGLVMLVSIKNIQVKVGFPEKLLITSGKRKLQ